MARSDSKPEAPSEARSEAHRRARTTQVRRLDNDFYIPSPPPCNPRLQQEPRLVRVGQTLALEHLHLEMVSARDDLEPTLLLGKARCMLLGKARCMLRAGFIDAARRIY